MPDHDKTRPSIRIELGLHQDATPSLAELRRRARHRVEVVASEQDDLAFLTEGDFAEVSPLVLVDGQYAIVGPIPLPVQDRVDLPAQNMDERQDEEDERAINAALAAVTLSSELLEEVAALMSTSPTAAQDICRLERARGVNTRAIRSFVYHKQQEFFVEVEGNEVHFSGHVVRTAVRSSRPARALLTPVRAKEEGREITARVSGTFCDSSSRGIQRGSVQHFRFGRLEWWQSMLVELAHQKGMQIVASAAEVQSTYTLKSLPSEIQNVENWEVLLIEAIRELVTVAKGFGLLGDDASQDEAA